MAAQIGLSHDDAASAISRLPPAVVDQVTPDGTVPSEQHVAGALDALTQSASA